MANQNSAFLQRQIQFLAAEGLMLCKDKVCTRISTSKAKLAKNFLCLFSRLCNGFAMIHIIFVVINRRFTRKQGQPVDIIRIGRKLADLFVSNHFNAGGGDGYEALVYSQNRVELGEIFEKYVLEVGQNSRGVKIRSGLAVLKNTYMPAIINEGAFVDNFTDIQDWNEEAELKKLGEAYAKAAAEFLGLERKATPESEAKPADEGYSLEQFIKDVQWATDSQVDGIAGPETIGNTVTVSASANRTHPVVAFVQKRLYALGYTQVGTADGIAGPKFDLAVKAFQKDNDCVADGEITAKNKTWRTLLGMA